MAKLNSRQERFCQEYIIDLNGTAAAIRSGYRKHSAEAQACKLLVRENVKDLITKLIEARSKRTEITADMVVKELAKVGFTNIQDFLTTDNGTVDLSKVEAAKAAAIGGVKVTTSTFGTGKEKQVDKKVEFKLYDKVAALEKLGKHLGIFEKDNSQRGKKITIRVTTKKSNGG